MSTTHDPLAAYRRAPLPPKGGAVPPTQGPEEYVAFEAKDRLSRLRIRSRYAPINSPRYNILLNIVYENDGTHFLLIFTTLMVSVQGRNLQKVVFAIENELADYIQEFDSERWRKPSDGSQPFIDAIEIKQLDDTSMNEKKH